jgi:2-phospho-L-lactate/phosphoenolpyruvate guanylyltransferase
MMRTAAVLPVKRFSRAKQRLGQSVADRLRGRLAEAMVADVLHALAACRSIDATIVVTSEPAAAAIALRVRAIVVEDIAESGQSAAVSIGVKRALIDGFERVLCIPGDCPALDPAELDALLSPRPAEAEVVIVPDRHRTGTNGLLLSPPDAIAPSFGPGSFARHRRLARESGVACRVQRPPSLLLDVDTGEDLDALRERLDHERAGASRTRAALDLAEGRWRSSRSAA